MKWSLFFSIILIILSGCQSEDEPAFDISKFYITNTNQNNPDLREADSLVFYLHFEAGLEKYFRILDSDNTTDIKQAAAYSIQELRFQFPYLYQNIEWNNALSLDTSELGFYYRLRNDPKHISQEILDSLIVGGTTDQQRIKAFTQKSIYSDLDVSSNHDEMYQLIKEAYNLMKPYGLNNSMGLEIILQLQKVSRYHRESLVGLSVINNYINELETSEIDEDIMHLLKITKGNLYTDLAEDKLSRAVFNEVQNNYSDDPCHDHYHRALIGHLYLHHYDSSYDYDSILTEMENALKCTNRMSNIEHWLAVYDKKYDSASRLSYFDAAQNFELSIPFTNTGKLESMYYSKSLLYEKLKDYDKALNAYWLRFDGEKSIQMLLDTKPYKNEWVVLERFASMYYNRWLDEKDQNDLNTAISLLLKAESSANTLMASTDESTLLSYKYYQSKTYELLSKAYFDLYTISQKSEYKNLVIDNLSKRKNLLLTTEILSQTNATKIPKDVQQKRKNIEKQVAEVKQKYNYAHPSLETLLWRLDSINNISHSYQQGDIDYYKLNNRIPLSEIQDRLEGRSIISYNIMNDRLFIALINKDSTHLYEKILTVEILNKIKELAKWQADSNVEIDRYTILAENCHKYLFPDEMTPHLNDQLIIIPDGILNYISFEALVESNSPKEENAYPSFLLYKYDISTLATEQLLSYNKDLTIDENSNIDVFSYSSTASIVNSQNTSLSELPWAKEESEFIATTYKQSNLYTGKDATVSQFIESLKKENDIIHIATHGISSSTSRYDVKLYFRNPDFTIDSLYGYELLGIDVATKLIILTSCQSGTGAQVQSEGVYDLKRYLTAQGADKVIVSLWDLDDQSSYDIMQSFYTHAALDLRRAKIQFLEDYPDKSLPFYWAGLSS